MFLDCFLRPVVGKPSKYYNEVAKMEQDCAESTYYVPEKCGCDNLAVDIGVRRPSESSVLLYIGLLSEHTIVHVTHNA